MGKQRPTTGGSGQKKGAGAAAAAAVSSAAAKCVCCGGAMKKAKCHNIFDEYGKFRRIQFLLAECVQKKVTEMPGTVQAICTDCLNQLEQNYAFKLKCMKSEQQDDDDDDEDDDDDDDDDDEDADEEEVEDVEASGDNKADDTTTVCEIAENVGIDGGEDIRLFDWRLGVSKIKHPPQEVCDAVVLKTDELIKMDAEDADDGPAVLDAESEIDENIMETENEENHTHLAQESVPDLDNNENLQQEALLDHANAFDAMDYEHATKATTDGRSDPETEEQQEEQCEEETEPIAIAESYTGEGLAENNEEIIEEFTFEIEDDPIGIEYVVQELPDQNAFIASLTVHSLKEKLRSGIPVHPVSSSATFDDYGELCTDAEEADEECPIDIDEYVLSIVSVSFCPQTPFEGRSPLCQICEELVPFKNYESLLEHLNQTHAESDGAFTCCLNGCNGESCADHVELTNHLFMQHGDVINASCFLTCQTCDLITDSLVKFGKHVCNTDGDDPDPAVELTHPAPKWFTCNVCQQRLRSYRRFVFHQQFHCANPRPKVCLICDRIFTDERRFYEHVQFAHDQFAQHYCRYCDRSYTQASELRRHEHSHTALRTYSCKLCDKKFFDPASLAAHGDTHRAGYSCDLCGKRFNRKMRLRQHMALHVEHKPAELPMCELCGRVFRDVATAVQHWYAEHGNADDASEVEEEEEQEEEDIDAAAEEDGLLILGLVDNDEERRLLRKKPAKPTKTTKKPLFANITVEQVFCCEFCEAAFEKVTLLLAHKATHDEKSDESVGRIASDADDDDDDDYRNDETEPRIAAAGTTDSASQNARSKIDEMKFRCPYCPRRFAEYSRLRSHANAHPESRVPFPVQRMYVCELDDCQKPYSNWHNYQTHRKTVHLINPSIIRCSECNEIFYKSWLYAYHKKSVHQQHKQCPLCSQTFVLQRTLDDHMARAHVGGQRFGKARKWKQLQEGDELPEGRIVPTKSTEVRENVHYVAMEDAAGFRCLECGKTSVRRSNAVSHVQMVHMKIRNFACNLCTRTFFHRGDLNDHLKMHNAITPFQCTYCPHRVRTKSQLKVHIRAHTNERPFQCPECPKAFKRRMVLKNHLKLHEGSKEHTCDQCDLAFYTKYSLATHVKTKHNPEAVPRPPTVRNPKIRTKKKPIPSMIIVMPGPPDKKDVDGTGEGEIQAPRVFMVKNAKKAEVANAD